MRTLKTVAMKSALAIVAWAVACSAITPEEMLAAPRRGSAVPNNIGTLAVFSETTYSWEEHESSTVWKTLDLASGEVSLLTKSSAINEIVWIGPSDTSVLYVNGSNSEVEGGVEIWASDIGDIEGGYKVASIPAPLAGLKAAMTPSGDINFLMYGKATADKSMPYNEETAEEPVSSAKLYDSIFVRHWDVWVEPETYTVWSGVLTSSSSGYSFDGTLKNLLAGLEGVETPWQPFGDEGDYDISSDGQNVLFLSKAPEVPIVNYTTSYIFLVPHDGSSTAAPINNRSSPTTPPNARGASSGGRFSPDGTKIAYFQMDEEDYESDRNKLYIYTIGGEIASAASDWDRSPDHLEWLPDGSAVMVQAGDFARVRLFLLPIDAPADFVPNNLTDDGSVSTFYMLPDASVLVSATAIYNPRDYYIASTESVKPLFAANEVDEVYSGMSSADLSEFWVDGDWHPVQSYIIYPEGFSEDQVYPLAFIVHGGPQGTNGNSWSTRWNPKVWADQGYVVVEPNPTGSTTFGEEFCDMIQNDWGGAPYRDLVIVWEYVRDNIPYIDTDNGIAAGASFGGYMMNWMQGHDLGREFKTLVTHDGSTSSLNQYATEELWFMQHDFNGTLWENWDNYARWNPINHINNWATPHFVVHNPLDYRLPISEGIMLFNILQEKGIPSRFLSFPDENHWVLDRENSKVWHNEIFKWINHYSGIAES